MSTKHNSKTKNNKKTLWKILQNKLLIFMKMVFSVPLYDSYCNNYFDKQMFSKNIEIIMLVNWQGINPMGLIVTLVDYKNKQLFANTKISPTTLRLDIKNLQGINPIGLCSHWSYSYIHNWKIIKSLTKKHMNTSWKALDPS